MDVSSSNAGFEGAARDFPLSWEFRPEGGPWAPISVPGPWQRVHPGFHGRGEYRAFFARHDAAPLVIEFEAVATEARVFVNGSEAGGHLGAWTPFRVDLTPHLFEDLRKPNEIVVRVDEKPDHTTAGFLPFIGAAFGGIWGRVRRVFPGISAEGEPNRPKPGVPSGFPDPGIRAGGGRILRQGRPLLLRGMLHWGYYPELGAPMPSRASIDEEIGAFRALGFNMIKFCLFFPPERYLEACDAARMWVWMEYPVWNRPLCDPSVLGEFEEFLRIDSRHPSVIIRTFTCENDRVDEDLARRLYAMAKAYAPGGLVLDNSSWISLEKVGDFYDEHPYLHNGEWRFYGERMRRALAGREAKPFLLGETMGVDTWTGREEETPAEGAAEQALADPAGGKQADIEQAGRAPAGAAFSTAGMRDRSLRIANRIRKHQVEVLMRELPGTGYVMNVVRDIPSAPLGFFTAEGRAKFEAKDWAWHGDTMILCDLEERSFFGGETAAVGIFAAHFGRDPLKGRVACRFGGRTWRFPVALEPGATRKAGDLRLSIPKVKEPKPLRLEAVLEAGETGGEGGAKGLEPAGTPGSGREPAFAEPCASNSWTLWAVPAVDAAALPVIKSLDEGSLRALEAGASRILAAGPRKGSWKSPTYTWWSPVIRFVQEGILPEDFVEDLIADDLLSGRVLTPAAGLVPLLEVFDTHMEPGKVVRRPLAGVVFVECGEGGSETPHVGRASYGESGSQTPHVGHDEGRPETPHVGHASHGEGVAETPHVGHDEGRPETPHVGRASHGEGVAETSHVGRASYGEGGSETPHVGRDEGRPKTPHVGRASQGEGEPKTPHVGRASYGESGSQTPHVGRREGPAQPQDAGAGTEGGLLLVTALRHDTPAGLYLLDLLAMYLGTVGGRPFPSRGSDRPSSGRSGERAFPGSRCRPAESAPPGDVAAAGDEIRPGRPGAGAAPRAEAAWPGRPGAGAAPRAEAARPGPPGAAAAPGAEARPDPLRPSPLLRTDSIVLEDWEMSLDGSSFRAVKCDTPLANGGKTIYEGWAAFRTRFEVPERWRGLEVLLCCEAVGDAYTVSIDGNEAGRAGKPDATWDGTRDRPAAFSLHLDPGLHVIEIQARDWRAGGGLVGPVYLTRTPEAAVY